MHPPSPSRRSFLQTLSLAIPLAAAKPIGAEPAILGGDNDYVDVSDPAP